jgi:hypothetical protein
MTHINNNKDKVGTSKDNYTTDANLIVYDNFNSSIMTLGFVSVFPTSMDDVQISYRDNEGYLSTNVNFSYDYYEIK